MKKTLALAPAVAMILLGVGCGSSEGSDLPTSPPTEVKKLTDEGLTNIGGVESSPDGQTFYALAFEPETMLPGVFEIETETGKSDALFVGDPLLYPSDIAVSCDGSRLFVSDMGLGTSSDEFGDITDASMSLGGIHKIATDSGDRSDFEATGIARAGGIVLSTDCMTLYVTGWTDMGAPALFTVPVGGGKATIVHEGAPLRSPTGVHVDANDVAWVMDHLARGKDGEGMLFAITTDGDVSEVVSGLGMGRHGGVSLTPGGVTAVIPVKDEFDNSMLITANTETLEAQVMETPDIPHPTGVAAARNAPVMVVAGEYGLHIATFEE